MGVSVIVISAVASLLTSQISFEQSPSEMTSSLALVHVSNTWHADTIAACAMISPLSGPHTCSTHIRCYAARKPWHLYHDEALPAIGVSHFSDRLSATVHLSAFLAVREFVDVSMFAGLVHMIHHSGTPGQTPLRLSPSWEKSVLLSQGMRLHWRQGSTVSQVPHCVALRNRLVRELRTCRLVPWPCSPHGLGLILEIAQAAHRVRG